MVELDYGDLPIATPDEDVFGIDPFVLSLARSLRRMRTPQGVVVAINGPWGSGKSSAINLLQHHLTDAVAANELVIVQFNPWWFRGEEALVLAFFRELYAATGPSLGEKAKKMLPKLGAKLLKAGSVAAPIADLAGASGAGALVSGTMDWLSGLIESDGESVELLHSELSKALAAQQKRFVVLIDDIDRLAPDEALAMFRLVKSVGRLPNVLYVLAFDRQLAERAVAERFPSEGPHYLEKIVQAAFELPTPDRDDLVAHLFSSVLGIIGQPDEQHIVHFYNMFHEVVAPEINTPRDVVRYRNALSVTWPAVTGDVDAGDFIALEAYRLFQPSIYAAIRRHGAEQATGTAPTGDSRASAEELDALFLGGVIDTMRYRRGLVRLFPRLASGWDNMWYSLDRNWARDRRICSRKHFRTYFGLSPSEATIPRAELKRLLESPPNVSALQSTLRIALGTTRRDLSTRAPIYLEALTDAAEDVPLADCAVFLGAIFAMADELDRVEDEARGFALGDNWWRITWLMRAMLMDRTTLPERSAILMEAVRSAGLSWLLWLSNFAWRAFHPRQDGRPKGEHDCILTLEDATALRATALEQIRVSAADGTLIGTPRLDEVLFSWLDMADDGGAEIKAWSDRQLDDDRAVARLARAFMSTKWSQSGDDLVARGSDKANVHSLADILDRDRFRARVVALDTAGMLDQHDADAVRRFRQAWEREDAAKD